MGLLSQALQNFFPLNKGDNDFTSSCKIPYFNASNNPYGCVSPSKLASVLGVIGNRVSITVIENSDLDFLTEVGYCCVHQCTNMPTDTTGHSHLFVFRAVGTDIFQILYYPYSTLSKKFVRYMSKGSWTNWTKIYG